MKRVLCLKDFPPFKPNEMCFVMDNLFSSSSKNNMVRSVDNDNTESFITDKELEDNFEEI